MLLGEFELITVSDGTFRLDGGAMFGVVPKSIWDKINPADPRNRILLSLNCLLVCARRTAGKNILIDTGIGSRFEEKSDEIYEINRSPGLEENLKKVGTPPEKIDFVILTHLHFDHCGGNTKLDSEGNLVPSFPNAEYVIQRKEWEDALSPNERTKGSYREDDLLALERAGQLKLIDGDYEVVPGISVIVTGGHTRGHQIVSIENAGKRCIFWGDLIPTTGHINVPFIMSYDLFPLETIAEKKKWEEVAVSEKCLCYFEHDPRVTFAYLVRKGKHIIASPV
jgi:glyoxylase-like metal-dependent hydrolase (beta-lactamase superfamily II)